jgi:hypothetical protein
MRDFDDNDFPQAYLITFRTYAAKRRQKVARRETSGIN